MSSPEFGDHLEQTFHGISRSLLPLWSAETPQLRFLFRGHAAPVILANVNLRRPCSPDATHLPHFLNPACMMADTPVFRAKNLEQRIQPLMHVLEVFAEFPAAVLAMFFQ